MRFIYEDDFRNKLAAFGMEPDGEGRELRYRDGSATLGFDFTNLAVPTADDSLYESSGAGERGVEQAMARVIFKLVEGLNRFPVYVFASDDEWGGGEELAPFVATGRLSKREAAAMAGVVEGKHRMDVGVIGPGEGETAAALIVPQTTLFQGTCHVVAEGGAYWVTFSPDEEVSFNTRGQAVYDAARAALLAMGPLPFEVVWVEDFL
ncbi:MAG: hypothetical protein HY804_02100 [Nitrospinae bacterium]|nr:hypothetical protein [Nitrospinota bacterium]